MLWGWTQYLDILGMWLLGGTLSRWDRSYHAMVEDFLGYCGRHSTKNDAPQRCPCSNL